MSKPFSIRIIELGDDATNRLNFWRQTLLRLSSHAMPGFTEIDPLGQELRGAAVVAAMAEIERLLREALVDLALEINQAGVPISVLRPGLRALASDSHFNAIGMSPRGDRNWENRAIVTRMETSMQIAKLPTRRPSSPQPPLDGKTIRSIHFQRIWAVLDLDGEAIPALDIDTALSAMSSIRNDVAHGNAPVTEIFHEQALGKSATDIAQHILHLIRLVDHFCLSLSSYAYGHQYRVV